MKLNYGLMLTGLGAVLVLLIVKNRARAGLNVPLVSFSGEPGQNTIGAPETLTETIERIFEPIAETVSELFMNFQSTISKPANRAYVAYIRSVEAQKGLPPDLLVRLAYQESRFRQDIITGKKISSAGAVGMFQIVPRWHPNVNPLDWKASAVYAANYLLQLKKQFGTWKLALAAYNWGPGNLRQLGINQAPEETRNYYSQIMADIGLPTYA